MTEYSRHKRDREMWYSTPFYTRPGGYKLCLGVNTYTDVKCISVHVYLMRGEYDDALVWPICGNITVQLVNLIGDCNHRQAVFHFSDDSLMISRSRVTSGERAKNGCGDFFIPLIYVESGTNTWQYGKDNCLTFRVTSAVVNQVIDDCDSTLLPS